MFCIDTGTQDTHKYVNNARSSLLVAPTDLNRTYDTVIVDFSSNARWERSAGELFGLEKILQRASLMVCSRPTFVH